jgi:methyl-accepting chemotaxis protein
MSSLNELVRVITRVVTEEQIRAGTAVGNLLESAAQLGEHEISMATENLGRINRESRDHISNLRDALNNSQEKHTTAIEMIDHQTRYSREIRTALTEQGALARDSISLSQEISKFVEVIGKISSAARILTVNGQIESARLGREGAAFSVIVQEMRELSNEVQKANQAISELAGNLIRLMPAFEKNATDLLQTSENFSKHQATIVSNFTALAEQEKALLDSAEVRAQQISKLVATMVTHLQFQDRVAQGLNQARERSQDQDRFVQEFLQLLTRRVAQDSLSESDILDCVELARGPQPAPQTEVATAVIPDDGVLLF